MFISNLTFLLCCYSLCTLVTGSFIEMSGYEADKSFFSPSYVGLWKYEAPILKSSDIIIPSES